jgi:hypothetical protein
MNQQPASSDPVTPRLTFRSASDIEILPTVVGQSDDAAQFQIIIKRNDGLYRFLSILNTVLSIFGVLVVVATFFAVCYGVIMITEAFDTVTIISNQNAPS